jgi:DNA-binding MarR family transcriptional regulator
VIDRKAGFLSMSTTITHPLVLVRSRRFGSATRKQIASLLADHCHNQDWVCWLSQERLAAEAELTERTVRKVLAELEAEGLIRRQHRYSTDSGERMSDYIWLIQEAIEALPPTGTSFRKCDDPGTPTTGSSPRAYRNLTTKSGDHSSLPETPVETPNSLPAAPVTDVTPTDDTADFDFFWSLYPRKEDKAAARKAWKAATKKATADTIIDGARRYAAFKAGEGKKFIKLGATWLNGECWENEYVPDKPTPARGERTVGETVSNLTDAIGIVKARRSA